ncbi:MAG: VWA-like domain-containing protein [Armatimonadota bacterium]|nr:VWA-like domain-containing protein [Armatimonadota bacterium]
MVDTSRSISDSQLARALAEVDHLLRRHLEEVRVTWWDAAHHGTQRLRRVRQARPRGGGGTDMAAAIRHAEQSRPRPDLVVVITDGLTPWPAHRPQVPVVVVLLDPSTRAQCPSWARVVEVSA